MIADHVRDEAIAIAKRFSHAEVEPRHVLWAAARMLEGDPAFPVSIDLIRSALSPSGNALAAPTVFPAAEQFIELIHTRAAAGDVARAIATELGLGASTEVAIDGAASSSKRPDSIADARSPESRSDESNVAAILLELDALAGLDSVKAQVRRIIAVQQMNEERTRLGKPAVASSRHLVFTGDPGTGKTTVARIIARLYGATGLVSRGHLIEVSRADLVAGYVGQTAIRVKEVVTRALGGVLFIDEAYALAGTQQWDFGDEAIATLVKMMEDHRDDVAVIAAGYGDEMQEFIASNPGLRSRFTSYIHFPNFTIDQLVDVFHRVAERAEVIPADGVRERVAQSMAAAAAVPGFGNARYVRSYFEEAYANMAARAFADGRIADVELHDLTVDDLPPRP